MSSRLVGFAFAMLVVQPRLGVAQSLGPERRDVGDLRGDIWAMWTSPVHADRRAILPVAAVAGAFALTALKDSTIFAWMATHPNSVVMHFLRPMREHWKLPLYEGGSGQYILPVSAALYTAGRLSRDVDLRDAGLGCAAGHLSSAALRDVIYLLVARVRPNDSPNADKVEVPGKRAWGSHSFLSGHIANSMACASFLSHRYSLGIAEPAMYAYVTAIGVGRVADGWHWMSDAVAGAAMGFAIGKAIADRQESRLITRTAVSQQTAGISIPIWTISF